eukprot:9641794-Alexandrium_andersonii.AAC.1
MKHDFRRSELQLRNPRTRPQIWSQELPGNALCAVVRVESDGRDEKRRQRPESAENQTVRTAPRGMIWTGDRRLSKIYLLGGNGP